MTDKETKAIIDNIVSKLQFIANRSFFRDMRKRYATDEQFEEEYKDFEQDMKKLWFEAKNEYCENKEAIDDFLNKEDILSESSKESFKAMKKVINDEIEKILLGEADGFDKE